MFPLSANDLVFESPKTSQKQKEIEKHKGQHVTQVLHSQ